LASTRFSEGGFFVDGEYVMFRQTNPIHPQTIALTGFVNTSPVLGNVGEFRGSAIPALNANFVSGPDTYQPGFKVGLGYKFEDATTLSLDWMYLFNSHRTGGATFARKDFAVRQDFADSFLFAPVFNFPPEFGGPNDIADAAGNPIVGAANGIWNGA